MPGIQMQRRDPRPRHQSAAVGGVRDYGERFAIPAFISGGDTMAMAEREFYTCLDNKRWDENGRITTHVRIGHLDSCQQFFGLESGPLCFCQANWPNEGGGPLGSE